MAAPSGKSSEGSDSSVSVRSLFSSKRESVEVARPPDATSGLGSVSATDALEFLDQVSYIAACMLTLFIRSCCLAGCCQQNQSRTCLETQTQVQFVIGEH